MLICFLAMSIATAEYLQELTRAVQRDANMLENVRQRSIKEDIQKIEDVVALALIYDFPEDNGATEDGLQSYLEYLRELATKPPGTLY